MQNINKNEKKKIYQAYLCGMVFGVSAVLGFNIVKNKI
jgi:hypothetical protein